MSAAKKPSKLPRRPARHSLRGATGSESRCRLIPVPLGAKIQPWHWWKTPELSMTEAEREYYHGNPLTGETLEASGKLYEVRIPNTKLTGREQPPATQPQPKTEPAAPGPV